VQSEVKQVSVLPVTDGSLQICQRLNCKDVDVTTQIKTYWTENGNASNCCGVMLAVLVAEALRARQRLLVPLDGVEGRCVAVLRREGGESRQ
jgi:hypothetical protein